MKQFDDIIDIFDWPFEEEYPDTYEEPKIEYVYTDTGCEVSEKCIKCPFPICKHDDKSWFIKQKSISQNQKLIEAIRSNVEFPKVTNYYIAEKFNVSLGLVSKYSSLVKNGQIDYELMDIFSTFIHKQPISPD